jgi:hypothetical protein
LDLQVRERDSVRVADTDAPGTCCCAVIVHEIVAIDQNVVHATDPSYELIRVDTMTAGASRLRVIAEQVALNDGLIAARIIRQAYAGDVVLDDVVGDVSTGGSGSQIYSIASKCGRTILHRETINNDIVSSNVQSTAVFQDGFRSSARCRTNAELGSLHGNRLVYRDYARDRVSSGCNVDGPIHKDLVDGGLDRLLRGPG